MTLSRDRLKLPVTELRKYPKKWYYVVEYEGRNYQVQLMPFQRESNIRPERLHCLVEHNADGTIFIKQDFGPLLASRYQAGQLYDFTVEEDYTATSTPHYKVADGSGFWFKLYSHDGGSFRRGDHVRCRVTRVSGINVSLEAVARITDTSVPVLDPAEIARATGATTVELIKALVEGDPNARRGDEQLAEKDYRWIFSYIEAVWEALERPRGDDGRLTRAVVEAINRVALYLLEDTRYLSVLDAAERTAAQQKLSVLASRSEDLLCALDIVEREGEQEYITDVLNKMDASGYLYHPEKKLRVLMYIFVLRKESMDSNMQKLLEIIHRGSHDNWSSEPFRTAFVSQLELYIDGNHSEVDSMSVIDTPADRERIEKMLQALAIQQLLINDTDTGVDAAVNRSRLYRFFTFISRFEQGRLLDKALTTLRSRSVAPDEFRWDETARIDTMATRLLAPIPAESTTMSFESPNGMIMLSRSGISMASDPLKSGRQALPADLNLWQNLNVSLPDQLPASLRQPVSLRDYKKVWTEIERVFFDPESIAESQQGPVLRTPDTGDEVTVIVDGLHPDNPLKLHCTIVDDTFTGQGWIVMKSITNMDRQAPLSSFRNADGRPYLLRAEVVSAPPGELEFNMRPAVGRLLNELVQPDDEVDCVITYCDDRQRRYIAFSENGYSLFIDPGEFAGEMRRSMSIRARVKNVSPDGLIIQGQCIATKGAPISYADAVQVLMASLSDEQVLSTLPQVADEHDEDAEARSADEMLTPLEVSEVMRIVGRMGDVEEDLVKRFNYLSFARVMALLLGDDASAEHYRRRCSVIEILDDFATNGQVDQVLLEGIGDRQKGVLTSTADGRKLLTLSMLDRPADNDRLWTIYTGADSEVLSRLARLVLAYNLLDGSKMGEERGHIRAEIYQLLNLRRDVQPTQIENGLESQTVEFKTSAIYPPGPRMRIDQKKQTGEIVEKITGMLNADGGTIYIGVSDEGYIRGLAPDMEFFGSRDRFELNLRNAINHHCGFIPNGNSHIVTSWEEIAGKEIYRIDITPIDDPVAFDGVYYQRQGTSNRFVPAEQTEQFLRARRGDRRPVPQKRDAEPDTRRAVQAAAPAPAVQERPTVATTSLRRNVLHDGFEGYEPVAAYLYFNDAESLTASATDLWCEDDTSLTLALSEEETALDLLLIYRSGCVAVAPMRYAIKDFEKEERRLHKNDPLVFAAPIAPVQGLILYSRDASGNVVKQAFRPEALPRVAMLKGLGERLMKDMTPVWAEIIPAAALPSFSGIMRNGQRVRTDAAEDIASFTAPRLGFEVDARLYDIC